CERQGRTAVGSFDQCRYALAHVVVRGRALEDATARMRVDVDEAGRDDLTRDVDDACRLRVDPRRDPNDLITAHRDVADIPRVARAVDDATVAEQEIVMRGSGGRRGR